jgi:hypothetical protein
MAATQPGPLGQDFPGRHVLGSQADEPVGIELELEDAVARLRRGRRGSHTQQSRENEGK